MLFLKNASTLIQADAAEEFPNYFGIVKRNRLRQMLKQADKEGNPYAAIHLNEEEHIHLLDQQEGKDFYVPTEKEITELVELGYLRTPAMTALEVSVKSLGGDPSFVTAMWPLVSADKLDVLESIHYAMDHAFPDSGAPSMEAVQSMLKFIQDYLNSIKLRTNRGWDPTSLRKKVGPPPKGPLRIVPGSVQMAKMLKEAEPDLNRMGMQVYPPSWIYVRKVMQAREGP